ncbi:MAG: hypothetical protein RLZZ04_1100 [Cyanobacteriota bacterium]
MNKVLPIQKWQIVQWSTLIIATVFALILLAQGMKEDTFRLLIRLTARSSCILFLLAFIASSCHKLKPSQVSQWSGSPNLRKHGTE